MPRTEAGKALLEAFTTKPDSPDFAIRISQESVIRHAIPRIEAEAVTAALDALAAEVAGMVAARGGLCVRVGDVCSAHGEMWYTTGCEDEPANLAAVLAAIVNREATDD